MTGTVFLDLDGTLVDPARGMTAALGHALRTLGVNPPEDLAQFIGPPLRETFAALGADPEEGLRLYRARYGDGALFEAHVYPGIPEALDRMGRQHRLCLATAKPHVFAARVLDHFGLTARIDRLYGPELDGTRDDKADLLAWALDDLDLAPGNCVMVGDHANDARAAAAVGMRSIHAAWGHGRDAGPRFTSVARTPTDLPGAVAAHLARDRGPR